MISRENVFWIILFVVIAIVGSFILTKFTVEKEDFTNCNNCMVLLYSSACPHCHNLIEFLNKTDKSVKIYMISDRESYIKAFEILRSYNFTWDGGVPLLFTVIDGKIYVIQGFPAKGQEKDGYILGKDTEEALCLRVGDPYYENGTYKFCKIRDNMFIGNRYSVSYLLDLCEKNECYVRKV